MIDVILVIKFYLYSRYLSIIRILSSFNVFKLNVLMSLLTDCTEAFIRAIFFFQGPLLAMQNQ